MAKDVIIACDFESKEKVLNFLDLFKDVKPFVKIGRSHEHQYRRKHPSGP